MFIRVLVLTIFLLSLVTGSEKATVTCTDSSGQTTTETFTCYENNWGVEGSTNAYLNAGADRSKLAVGLAFYSHVFGKT